MDLTFIQIFVLLGCAALINCEVSQQKLTGDESSLSTDSQVTESTLTSAGGSAKLSGLSSSSSSSSSLSSSSSTTASPSPYSFSYNTADVAGTQLVRQEAGDGNGAVRGRYGYRDADGLYRTVEYIADSNGFRAAIRSNEPGLGSSPDFNERPASIFLQTEATPAKVASKVASASSLARIRAAQATLATATPTTTFTTQRPAIVSTATTTTTSQSRILNQLNTFGGSKGGGVAPARISVTRKTPIAPGRANSARQSARLPSTLRLVSSQAVSLTRLSPTTTTTTTTEAPATVSQQFLAGQQEDQQVRSTDEQDESDSLGSDQQLPTNQQKLTSEDQQIKSTDEQDESDSLGSDQQLQGNQQKSNSEDQHDQHDQHDQQDQQEQVQQVQVPQVQVRQTPQVRTVQPAQPTVSTQTVQQKQAVENPETDQQTDSAPVQPEVTFNDNDEAEESLPTVPAQPQPQPQPRPQLQPRPQPQPQIQTQIQPQIQTLIQPQIQTQIQPQIQTQMPHAHQLPPPHAGQMGVEQPLLVRFLDEDLTYDSIEFPHMLPQPRTIAVQTDDHPLSRLFRIEPIPHQESVRLHQAGANMMYLTSAQSY